MIPIIENNDGVRVERERKETWSERERSRDDNWMILRERSHWVLHAPRYITRPSQLPTDVN